VAQAVDGMLGVLALRCQKCGSEQRTSAGACDRREEFAATRFRFKYLAAPVERADDAAIPQSRQFTEYASMTRSPSSWRSVAGSPPISRMSLRALRPPIVWRVFERAEQGACVLRETLVQPGDPRRSSAEEFY
jgi:hypothetical protein